MQFLGHLNRQKGLEHLALTGKTEGKQGRGRARMTYLENRKRWAQEKDRASEQTMKKLSQFVTYSQKSKLCVLVLVKVLQHLQHKIGHKVPKIRGVTRERRRFTFKKK